MIELLSECNDQDLVFKYAEWVFQHTDTDAINVRDFYNI